MLYIGFWVVSDSVVDGVFLPVERLDVCGWIYDVRTNCIWGMGCSVGFIHMYGMCLWCDWDIPRFVEFLYPK